MVGGIVAEFNPFHNGHEYLLKKAREISDEIVVVMSPNVCQRGEFTVFDKYSRARAAVMCGADLVLELPCISAVAAAADFSAAAVKILSEAGAERLIFGSECGSTDKLYEALYKLRAAESGGSITEAMKEGESYPKTVGRIIGDGFRESPNDILAMEYLKNLPSHMTAEAVARTGVGHNGEAPNGDFASASFIRGIAFSEAERFIPPSAYKLFSSLTAFPKERGELLELSFLKRLSEKQIAICPGVTEGLENRIKAAISEAKSLEEALFSVKTKRYTLSRIRRIFLSLYLGISKEDEKAPQYIRVLALNEKGRDIIHRAKKNSSLPIITSLADALKMGKDAAAAAKRESFSCDLYNFSLKNGAPDGDDFRFSPIPFNK